jgi:Transposase
LFCSQRTRSVLAFDFADGENDMADEHGAWTRQGEAFWRAHHEAWKRSDLNQRQYCEAEGIPLKAFGNWRAQFKAEPQPPERKLLYRRRPLSPPLSPPVSPPLSPLLSPVTYPSSRLAGPIVPRPREGHRRRFSDADKQWILQEAARPDVSAAEVARRYGIAQRILRRWKQELAATEPAFVTVQITDADASLCATPAAVEVMS